MSPKGVTVSKEEIQVKGKLRRMADDVDINSKIRKTPVENVKKHREKLWTNI